MRIDDTIEEIKNILEIEISAEKRELIRQSLTSLAVDALMDSYVADEILGD